MAGTWYNLGHISMDVNIIQCAVKSEIMVHTSPLQIINRKKTHSSRRDLTSFSLILISVKPLWQLAFGHHVNKKLWPKLCNILSMGTTSIEGENKLY